MTHLFCLYKNNHLDYCMVTHKKDRGEYMKSQILILGTTVILTVIVVFAAVILGNNLNDRSRELIVDPLPESTTKPSAVVTEPTSETSVESISTETTSIPGYDLVKMKSGQLDQNVRLYNPSNNSCYFLITIYLPDGKEIYRSDLIAPGDSIDRIRLSTKLEKGLNENAMLVYSCYSVDNLQPMNGATVKFTLEVI